MSTVRRRESAAIGMCLVAALLIVPVQDRVHGWLGEMGPAADILYFGSPSAVKKMALGFDGLLADIYWMRAIQYYGRRDEAARRAVPYSNLAALLDITSTLDPGMTDVYRTGSAFLAEPAPIGAGQPEEAIKLLDKGIGRNPGDWCLFLDKGFIYFWFMMDYKKAGDVWLSASCLSASPPWMEGLAASALSKGGEVDTAKMLWQHQLEQSSRAEVRENARNHLLSIEVDETLWTLEFFIHKYREKYGRLPGELADLVKAGFLRVAPDDPSGVPYAYEPSSGNVRLSPNTGVHYLLVPHQYRDAYLRKIGDATLFK